ncbi:MAG: MerR family transcriptional regulator [Clostridia bacterium]|nr:MerR family transcriptional regulator [Clostridia bacterium]
MKYTRGQFAVMGNVGRKALRLYHEEGLLVPVSMNEENGYHYYDDTQLETLERIKRHRKIGLSLFEIKQILDGKAREEDIVESKIKEAGELLSEMKALAGGTEQKKETAFDGIPDIQPFERTKCIYIEENVELENLGMSVGKLYERAAREGMTAEGSHFVRYEGLLDDGKFRMVTCLPVSQYAGGDTMEIREPKCLHLNYTGGFSRVSEAHRILRKYAEEQGTVLADRVYEVYNKDMSVDVYYPIR